MNRGYPTGRQVRGGRFPRVSPSLRLGFTRGHYRAVPPGRLLGYPRSSVDCLLTLSAKSAVTMDTVEVGRPGGF